MNQQAIKQCKSILKKNHLHPLRKLGKDQGWIFMVMEYCDRGNLNTKVTETQANVLTLEETFYITWDIICGLEYMHNKNLIHRDIKAENILLSSKKQKKSSKSKKNLLPSSSTSLSSGTIFQYVTKICDLGFTRQEDESVNTFCGTTCYMAPQIFQKSNYDNKVDIWALGVLIFYMLFGQFPFKSLNVEFQIEKKCSDGFKIANVAGVKANQSISRQDMKALEEFFKKIFMVNPSARISLQQIKAYPWFKKMRSTSKELPTSSNKLLGQKVMSSPKLAEFRSSQKTTIESDSSSSQHTNSNSKQRNIEIEKYIFVKQIIGEVQKQKFLKNSEELAFKYYMYKMLHCQFGKTLQKGLKNEFKKDIQGLSTSLDKYTNLMSLNIGKISIPKFQPQLFNPKAKSFNQFKQPYRLVIGHVFAKAHKNITEDIHIRSQLKLKLFICHVINRVFNVEHNEGIFVHYDEYCKKLDAKQKVSSKDFSFRSFRKWIQSEQPQKLVETVQLMNAKFYKGK